MNYVENAMAELGIKTVREFASMCKVSDKTMTGWKKNIPQYGMAIIDLLVENQRLKKELEKHLVFKKAFKDYMDDE